MISPPTNWRLALAAATLAAFAAFMTAWIVRA